MDVVVTGSGVLMPAVVAGDDGFGVLRAPVVVGIPVFDSIVVDAVDCRSVVVAEAAVEDGGGVVEGAGRVGHARVEHAGAGVECWGGHDGAIV